MMTETKNPHIAARIIHIDNEEKKKIRRRREEQAREAKVARATLPYDNNDEEDHFDNYNYDQDDLYVAPNIII